MGIPQQLKEVGFGMPLSMSVITKCVIPKKSPTFSFNSSGSTKINSFITASLSCRDFIPARSVFLLDSLELEVRATVESRAENDVGMQKRSRKASEKKWKKKRRRKRGKKQRKKDREWYFDCR